MTTMEAACHDMAQACRTADVWAAEAVTQAELLGRFALLDDILREVKTAHEAVGREVLAAADDGDKIPGGGVLRIAGGHERKTYDVPLLRGAVARSCAILVGMDDDPRIDAVVEAAWTVPPTTPSVSFRSGAAKHLGIRLADYAVVDTTPRTIRVEDRPARVWIDRS